MGNANVLEISGVNKKYKDQIVLEDVNFSIKK